MTVEHPGNKRTLLPEWAERYVITGLIGLVMVLADRRISSIEARLEAREKAEQEFQLQYATDRATLLDGQRATLHDLRVLCGHKNLNLPCPTEE